MDFRNAVKAFIVKDDQLLLLKRRSDDPHKPGAWDIPGGRLESGEDPYEGLRREVREEIDGEVDVVMPLDVHFFTRGDGQKIQMTIFLCTHKSSEIKLSEEHQEYKWVSMQDPIENFPDWIQPMVQRFHKFDLGKHI